MLGRKKKPNRVLVTNRTVNWRRVCRICAGPFQAEAVEERLCPACRTAAEAKAMPPHPPRDPAA